MYVVVCLHNSRLKMPLYYKKHLLFLLIIVSANKSYGEVNAFPTILAVQKPVLHLSFDDGTGSDLALDTSVNMNDGTLTNMDSATDWVIGVAGMAIDTDGANDYVSVADDTSLDFGTSDFTVSYWFYKYSTTSSYSYGVNKWSTGANPGNNEWTLSPATGFPQVHKAAFVIEIGSTAYGIGDPNTFTLNAWHHLVGVRQAEKISLYVDGVLVNTRNDIPVNASINNVGRELRIGQNQNTSALFPMAGMFDDLQIYRLAATDGDVTIGNNATGDIAILFNNPGMELPFEEAIFKNSFEN